MKTLKFTVIAVLVAFTMASLASPDGFKGKPVPFKKVVNISLEKALGNPGLVAAMYDQVSKEEILNSMSYIFVAEVAYDGNIYRIAGTRPNWLRFIYKKGILPIDQKKGSETN